MIAKLVGLIFLLVLALPVTAAQHSSEAILSSAPTEIYRSTGQPNRLAASMVAKQQCEQAKGSRVGYCEIVSMDGEPIGRASELKPKSLGHPLFLWRYTHGRATVYLAGTVHVLKEGFFPLPRQYEEAFQASNKLVVEAAIEKIEPQKLQDMLLGYAQLPEGTLRELLPAKTYARLDRHAQNYGLPLAQMQGFNPAFVSQQLSVTAISAMGYDPSLGIEAHFSARTNPENILELESVEAQLRLLLGQPLDVQTVILSDTVDEFDNIAEQTDTMLAAWAAGDDGAMARLIREQSGDSAVAQDFMYALLDKRNTQMAQRIADMLKGSDSHFVLVGSAHLAGKQSVITELRRLGFDGQRISSSDATIHGHSSS